MPVSRGKAIRALPDDRSRLALLAAAAQSRRTLSTVCDQKPSVGGSSAPRAQTGATL